jgi:hypothetical protein
MPVMIWVAVIVEAAILNWLDFGILLFINLANASLSYYETTKAGDAIAALKSSLKPFAVVKRGVCASTPLFSAADVLLRVGRWVCVLIVLVNSIRRFYIVTQYLPSCTMYLCMHIVLFILKPFCMKSAFLTIRTVVCVCVCVCVCMCVCVYVYVCVRRQMV